MFIDTLIPTTASGILQFLMELRSESNLAEAQVEIGVNVLLSHSFYQLWSTGRIVDIIKFRFPKMTPFYYPMHSFHAPASGSIRHLQTWTWLSKCCSCCTSGTPISNCIANFICLISYPLFWIAYTPNLVSFWPFV